MGTVAEHYATHLSPLYEWMVGDVEAALRNSAADLDTANIGVVDAGRAVDIGAGLGLHAIILAQRGYAVAAVDNNALLLDALRVRAGALPVTLVHDDLLNFSTYLSQPVDVITCMGDTLTHLQSRQQVEILFARVVAALAQHGTFVVTFRDYVTAPLSGDHRFIPVRSHAQRILTCFLEYSDDVVMVHDLLNQWQDGQWMQRISSYPKLRLAPEWVMQQLQQQGFAVRVDKNNIGMVRVVATT